MFTLPFEHVLIVGELIGEILLKGVLHRLLLKLNVPEAALLLLLLLTFVFLKRLLVSCGLAINQVLITNQLTTQFALVVRHLGAEVHLLGCVLLLKLLPQSSLLILVSILNLEVDLTKNVLLVQAQILKHVLVLFVGNLILDIVKLFFFDLEVLLDSIGLSVLLVGILAKKKLEHLLLLREVLHEQAGHALEELVTQVLIEESELLLLLLRSIIRSTKLLLEEVADELFVHLLLLLIFLFEQLHLVLDTFLLKLMLLPVLAPSEQECSPSGLFLSLLGLVIFDASYKTVINALELIQ